VLTAVCELEIRSDDEVLYRPRDQNVAWRRRISDPRSDMDGEASEVVTTDFALTGV
jgi:hypothetical protein